MKRNQQVAIAASVLGLALLVRAGCGSEWPEHDGRIRQTAELRAVGLRRGAPGTVYLSATGHYTRHDSDAVETFAIDDFTTTTLTLVDAAGAVTPLKVTWASAGASRKGTFALPEVPDGDYTLHAAFTTTLAKGEVDLPVPLYTPARIHVITDRPLYEPGNVVRFRAVVLRARDLTPIDGRPGRWIVRGPDDEILLEEKAAAGDFGVVAGTFPLDKAAEVGTWHVQWISNEVTDDVAFTVRPFTLPRFRVDAAASRPFYGANDAPVIRGGVVYSSGAPVANAKLDITWEIAGEWPPPVEWQERLLPKHATTKADGGFELALPVIPADLQGRATIVARIAAIDPAGDRVETSAAVLLSRDAIQASAVTELGDGLVQGANNLVYVRVTTPDGQVLPNAKIMVKRAWQATDPGIRAVLDEDGVAAVHLDPGPPVNVVIPAQPWRPQPRPPVVTRGAAEELIAGEGASLADQVEMDRWLAALAPCAKWFDPEEPEAKVGLRVSAAGAITMAGGGPTPLDQCVVASLRGKRLPAGAERMYAVAFAFTDPDLPALAADIESTLEAPDGLAEAIARLAASTRDCLPITSEGALPKALTWRAQAGSKDVQLAGWIADPQGSASSAAMACVGARITAGRIRLAEPAEADGFGLVRFTAALPARARQEQPQPTTMIGYELAITAEVDGAPTTRLRMLPGEIPDLRLRVTPVLAEAGEPVVAELIRSPRFTGVLPEELALDCLKQHKVAKVDAEHRATLVLPGEIDGWCEITGGGLRALVYIKPANDLVVKVTPGQPRYAPGQQATLTISTLLGGRGAPAAVGLFGVDSSLGELVTLAGPDDLGRVRPEVETQHPAFGLLDGQALTLGRIRGANAAAATVLRVNAIPPPAELDAIVNATAATRFDPIEELTDHFYGVLAELYAQARHWEATAPATATMRPADMVVLWNQALAACEKRGEKVDDAYGRRLRLRLLPADLLALTDPHVVISGNRLPEDAENWAAWVAQRRP